MTTVFDVIGLCGVTTAGCDYFAAVSVILDHSVASINYGGEVVD